MSTKYVKAVLDYLPVLTSPIDTLVLLAIAEHASDETRLAWPSVRSIVRRTRLCERAVHYALRRLEKLGVMSTTLGGQDQNDRSLNTTSRYRLEFDHAGRPLVDVVKQPPKRAPSTAPRRTASPRPTPAKQPSMPMPVNLRVKKISSVEITAADLAVEKQRQLAALKKLAS